MRLISVQGDDEDWVDTATSTVRIRPLEELFGGVLTVVDYNNLESTRTLPLVEIEIGIGAIVAPGSSIPRCEEIGRHGYIGWFTRYILWYEKFRSEVGSNIQIGMTSVG
jgi:hypothetical protein